MADNIIQIAENFWNIRGSFKIAGVIDIGTQASLVRLKNGRFVWLDSYTISDTLRAEIMELTDNGQAVAAIINLHPFHTVHCEKMHQDFPQAKLYGSARHANKLAQLPWESIRVDSNEFQWLFADDLEFSIPAGVDFISANENVHFSSVLAYHPDSKTIHVDDTLMYMQLPEPLRAISKLGRLSFHPTLAQALEKRANAGADFNQWAADLSQRWQAAENLCAAHTNVLLADELLGKDISERILQALQRIAGKLAQHDRKQAS